MQNKTILLSEQCKIYEKTEKYEIEKNRIPSKHNILFQNFIGYRNKEVRDVRCK